MIGGVGSVDLGTDGRPAAPVGRLRLDDWHAATTGEISAEAVRIIRASGITIGVATAAPPAALDPLLEAVQLTLAGPAVTATDRRLVPVTDPLTAYGDLADAIAERPQAALALGQLLRQAAVLPTTAGLAAEAAVYSMLLGGREFAAWLSGDRPGPSTSSADRVRLERDGAGLRVILDDPGRRNALGFRMREELYSALELAVVDEQISEVELTGSGAVFSSGGDLAEFGTATDLVAAYLVRLDRAPWRLLDVLRERLGDRLVVSVHGAAVGAGAELAAFGGRVTCTSETTFWLPELAMGLVPGAGGTVSITRRIGRWRAAWLMLTGDRLDASTALSWGLVDAVTPC